jgi:flagellar M-ring protein FliF
MNEWFKKMISQVRELWGKWSLVQKGIAGAIAAALILVIVLLAAQSSKSDGVKLLGTPVKDSESLYQIQAKLDELNIDYSTSGEGILLVSDQATARRARAILFRENLVPDGISPWDIFDTNQWQVTDLERDAKLKQAIMENLKQHIISLDEIDNAYVTIEIPEDEMYTDLQKPKTASITIFPTPGADFVKNRTKVNGLVSLVQRAVGIERQYITITDSSGIILNDDEAQAENDKQRRLKQLLELKAKKEAELQQKIHNALAMSLTEDRFSIINVNVEYEFDEVQSKSHKIIGTVIKGDDPNVPGDQSDIRASVPVSRNVTTESYRGEQITPLGPPGNEGQYPPGYSDRNDLYNTYDRTINIENEDFSTEDSETRENPWQVKKVSLGIVVDGQWNVKMKKGNPVINPDTLAREREYTPVAEDILLQYENAIKSAIGYEKTRGDKVTVENIQFDRSKEFAEADKGYLTRNNILKAVFITLGVIAAAIVILVAVRSVIRARERARRKREEELARKHAAMRDAALKEAEQSDNNLSLSGEDRVRAELEEDAMRLARENPEDVAHLIRTWLVEE